MSRAPASKASQNLPPAAIKMMQDPMASPTLTPAVMKLMRNCQVLASAPIRGLPSEDYAYGKSNSDLIGAAALIGKETATLHFTTRADSGISLGVSLWYVNKQLESHSDEGKKLSKHYNTAYMDQIRNDYDGVKSATQVARQDYRASKRLARSAEPENRDYSSPSGSSSGSSGDENKAIERWQSKIQNGFGRFTYSNHLDEKTRTALAGMYSGAEDADASPVKTGRPSMKSKTLFRPVKCKGTSCEDAEHTDIMKLAHLTPSNGPLCGPRPPVENYEHGQYVRWLLQLGQATAEFHLKHEHSSVLYYMNACKLDVDTSRALLADSMLLAYSKAYLNQAGYYQKVAARSRLRSQPSKGPSSTGTPSHPVNAGAGLRAGSGSESDSQRGRATQRRLSSTMLPQAASASSKPPQSTAAGTAPNLQGRRLSSQEQQQQHQQQQQQKQKPGRTNAASSLSPGPSVRRPFTATARSLSTASRTNL